MADLTVRIISFLIAACGYFFFGRSVLKKEAPLYFKLLIYSTACYMLQSFYAIVRYVCQIEGSDYFIGPIAIIGAFSFILSANYGQFDDVVDEDGENNRKYKALAALASCAAAVFIIITTVLIGEGYPARMKVFLFIVLLPSVPITYFSVKHLLLPDDALGLLKASRLSCAAALGYCIMQILFIYSATVWNGAAYVPLHIGTSIMTAFLTYASARGYKQWTTLI